MRKYIERQYDYFIENSITAFHAVKNIEMTFVESGFLKLDEKTKVEWGKSYYIKRDDGAIIGFSVPKAKFSSVRIVSSHADSPCYKLKANPTIHKNGYTLINCAPYGGMIHSSFMDRPLKIAGRIYYLDEMGCRREKLIGYSEPNVYMVNCCAHFNRTINKGYQFKPSKDLVPLFSIGEVDVLESICEDYNIHGEVLGHDLFLVCAEECRVWGKNYEFFSGPRIDDLACVFGSTTSLVEVSKSDELKGLAISAVFNNEEFGSGSYNGADSNFLLNVLKRISKDIGMAWMNMCDVLSNSLAISADNAHGLHPNYIEFYDINNAVMLNKGPVIKFSPNQKYTTTGKTAAEFAYLCKKAGVPYQTFENHSDVAGGSTLGNILMSQISVPSVDIGIAQLAMHSAVETAGLEDISYLVDVLREHFSYNGQ